MAEAVVQPALLALDVSGLSEDERRRLVRQEADRAIRELPASPISEPLHETEVEAASNRTDRLVELRSRFQAMRLTVSQQRVADTMLRLGTLDSREVGAELGVSPTTVRRHLQAIRLAASTAA